MKIENKKQTYGLLLVLAGVFIFYTFWAVIQPFGVSPDESMRYDVVRYMVEHMKIPDGRAEEIRSSIWGISYAYFPILPYMIMAIPAKIASLFTDSILIQVIASRMVNVCAGTIMAMFVWKIARESFEGKFRWLFFSLITFLPGLVFLHSYVNTDSMALMGISWIVYLWIMVLKHGWDFNRCIQMGFAISVCTLSYYNSYGFILCTIIFFITTMIIFQNGKFDYKLFFSRGCIIAAIVLLLCAWWFIRNYILYDGDFLGMTITDVYAEIYARPDLKPSVRQTPQTMGMSVLDMMLYQPGMMPHNWLGMVIVSFIGTFGYMDIFMPMSLSYFYVIIFAIGGLSALPVMYSAIFHRGSRTKKVERNKETTVVTYTYVTSKKEKGKRAFILCMIISIIIPVILAIRYSYSSDFQPQGRYIMPMILPFMFFITVGYEKLMKKLIKNEKIRNIIPMILSLILVLLCIYTYMTVFAPNYL